MNCGTKALAILNKDKKENSLTEKMDGALEELFIKMPSIYFGDLPGNEAAAKLIKRKRKLSVILYVSFLGLMIFASVLHHFGIIEAVAD